MSRIEFDYDALLDRLRAAGMQPLPELHGALCGIMSAGGRALATDWLSQQFDEAAPTSEQAAVDLHETDRLALTLDTLATETWQALSGDAMEFEPLLPGESADLGERVAALAAWCEGFLAGLALGGWSPERSDHAEASQIDEIVADLVEISRAVVGSEELDDPDAAEFMYVELSEFVRVSAQVAFDTLAPVSTEARRATIY
jgi:yecA family protein